MNPAELQNAKQTVRAYQAAFDAADADNLKAVLAAHCAEGYSWRGVHPFNELQGTEAVASKVWQPLRSALSSLQRRDNVFIAGYNVVDAGASIWVASLGHLMGLFDTDWLAIPSTRKLCFLPYAEFHRVDKGVIQETAFFCDILSVMVQAGCYPLPPATGATVIQPGPKTHDGLLFDAQAPEEGQKTIDLVNTMVADLSALNQSGNDDCPPEVLQKTWHNDMVWYGPAGIGATYTIPRYQEQHQRPFRTQLKDKVFNGHIARFGEGSYAGFFGWPNLTNTPTGGFMGLPGTAVRADMRVVDIYRRDGDKLAENWVLIDVLHWLDMQGLDVLERLRASRQG